MTRSLVAQETTPPDAAFMPGWSASGLREAPWILNAFSPAVALRSTIVDMTKYAQALMAENWRKPGMAPVRDRRSRFTGGYSWFTTAIKGRDIIWHDGQSAGYAAVMAFDPERKTAVVILSDTAWPVIVPAIKLLLSTLSDVKEER
jgi:CubicO group peptidase (beta-lactamase class C family)